jgi:hypothetical protein
MSKFSKPFRGVKAGEIYPTAFLVGEDCPAELESAARSAGAIEKAAGPSETEGQKLVAGNAADVIASLAEQKDLSLLTEARAAEAERQNPRTTVLAALDAAITALTPQA